MQGTLINPGDLRSDSHPWQPTVKGYQSAPPGAPAAGDRYAVATPGSGAWLNQSEKIAYWTGAVWQFYAASEGWQVWDETANKYKYFYNNIWNDMPYLTSLYGAALLGSSNTFSVINPLITLAESWIGPSNLAGIYFKDGKVGIGTTTPGTKLHLIDNSGGTETPFKIQVSDNANDYFGIGNSTAANGYFISAFSAKSDTTGWFTTGDSPTVFFTAFAKPDEATITKASMAFDARKYDNSGALVNRPLFSFGSFLNVKMLIAANGNVGLGTITPTVDLDITKSVNGDVGIIVKNGTSDTSARSYVSISAGSANSPNFGIYAASPGYTGIANWASRAVLYGGTYTSALTFISGKSDGRIDFAIGGIDPVSNQKMTIISTGKVGIGVTAPTAVLHLKAGTATADTAPLKFTSGVLQTSAQDGTIEYLSNCFYLRNDNLCLPAIKPPTAGFKLGTATTDLIGFYGVAAIDQPATVADPTGGTTIDAEARTAIGSIIDRLQELGLIA